MQPLLLSFALGTAAVVSVGAIFVCLDTGTRASEAQAAAAAHAAEIRDLEERVDGLSQQQRHTTRRTDDGAATRALEARVAELERQVAALAEARPAAAAATGGDAQSGAQSAADLAEFRALEEKVFGGTATSDESARFWELARTSDALPKLIERMEARVKEHPEDVDERMSLASAYVARLFTVPDGPERGAWALKADVQWREVLKRDERHWGARYSIATALSHWPPQFGRGPEAIRHLETLREQQESGAVEPRQAQVYFDLASLYRRQGRNDDALTVLRDGASRHPDDKRLGEALSASEPTSDR